MTFVFQGQVNTFEEKIVRIGVATYARFFVGGPKERVVKARNVVFQEMSTLRV